MILIGHLVIFCLQCQNKYFLPGCCTLKFMEVKYNAKTVCEMWSKMGTVK